MIVPRREAIETPTAVHGGRRGLAGEADAIRYDFSTCLNAFGTAAVIRRAIHLAPVDEYPDPDCCAPRAAASARWQRPVEEIAFGAGASELIHAACDAFLERADVVVIGAPVFGEFERAPRLRGARIHRVWRDTITDGADDVRALRITIERERPRLVVLCTPTTPSGSALDRGAIDMIANVCRDNESLLIVDQSYDAFARKPLGTPAAPGHPSVLHIRSLTKEHALAGLRLGFAVGHPKVIDALNRIRVPWSASSVSQAAAIAAMTDEASAHATRTVRVLRAEAARIRGRCAHLGFATSESTTHYFTVNVGDAAAVTRILLDRAAICVRDCTSFGLPRHIRVAARTFADNDALLDALALPELDPYRAMQRGQIEPEVHIDG